MIPEAGSGLKSSEMLRPGSVPFRVAIILATTGAGALWLIHKGPVPVVRITTPLPEMAPFWYMLLAFPVLGMLVADWVDLARLRGLDLATAELGCQIALIVGLSAVRLDSRIPLSGHALLIAYFLFRRLWLRNVPPPQSRLEIWLAAGALGGVAYPKLMWWDDPVTLLVGIGVAGGLAAVSGWVGRVTGGFRALR
jgi:hypothetical protein